MTPRFFVAALAALLPVAARAQTPSLETVQVDGNALVGVWTFAWPQWGRVGPLGGVTWGPMGDRYCRIERTSGDLAIHCLGGGAGAGNIGTGTGHVEGTQVHFAWGSMLLRQVMDGALQSPTKIAGKMGVKISGIEHENPVSSNATKFVSSETRPDSAGKAALLHDALLQLAQGALTLPHDQAAIAKTGGLPADIDALGAIQLIAYLGPSFREVPSVVRGVPNVEPDFASAYLIEFENGERLCGLHQRDNGVLDVFRCV